MISQCEGFQNVERNIFYSELISKSEKNSCGNAMEIIIS